MIKYELTTEFKMCSRKKLFRIKALVDFANVKTGDYGGYIENERNLSHEGNTWVYDNACIYGNTKIFGNAHISGNAYVFGDAQIYGDACISDNAYVFGNTQIYGNACVTGNAQIFGNACVTGNANIFGNAQIHGDACISSNAWICCSADYALIKGFGSYFRTSTFFKSKDENIEVSCGCFLGTIDEFREQVKKTRTGKIADEYLKIADLMEMHFKDKKKTKVKL